MPKILRSWLFAGALLLSSQLFAQTHITLPQYLQMKDQTPGHLLDVRADWEYAGGHLPGAQNLDIFKPDFDQKLALLDKTKVYYVYCHSGGRSREAAQRMQQLGFRQVYNLTEGIPAMQRAGVELKKAATP
ncbi:MAG: rhodanese-like domain-containing protein [Bacteroidetes bacterium]|nr:rhodanese-like domain-containing protein [Bacteroidota bacterium]